MLTKKRYELVKKRYGIEPTPEMLCPKWDYCSCNKCPLHKDYAKLQLMPDDKTKKCKCIKQIRKQIGSYSKLKCMGLTLKELNSMKQSIRMKEDFIFTKEKELKTPQNTPTPAIAGVDSQTKLFLGVENG